MDEKSVSQATSTLNGDEVIYIIRLTVKCRKVVLGRRYEDRSQSESSRPTLECHLRRGLSLLQPAAGR